MYNSIKTIAKFTFLEAIRNRLFLFILIGIICTYGLSKFIGELSVTERAHIEITMLGVSFRLFLVFIIGLFVTTSIVREFNDKGFELVLSQPVTRSSYYLGKLIGFVCMSAILVAFTALPLLLEVSILPVIFWCLSLICELMIVNALAIMCLFTFNNITLSFSAVVLFYFLSRVMEIIQLISDSPILASDSISQVMIKFILDCIAYVLPDLNSFAKTEWLVYEDVSAAALFPVLGQTLIYVVLLSAIALFDLYRKEL